MGLCDAAIDNEPLNNSIFSVGERLKVCTWGAEGDNVKMVTDNECKKNKNDDFYTEISCSQIKGFDLNNKIMSKLNKDNFELLYNNKTDGTLPQGVYKVVLAGGQGGSGANANTCSGGESTDAKGGVGGAGDLQDHIIILTNIADFTATIGRKGTNAPRAWTRWAYTTSWFSGNSGGTGGDSTLKINGKTYTAKGGGGGSSGRSSGCSGGSTENGSTGSPGGNGQNGNENGYVKIERYKF